MSTVNWPDDSEFDPFNIFEETQVPICTAKPFTC